MVSPTTSVAAAAVLLLVSSTTEGCAPSLHARATTAFVGNNRPLAPSYSSSSRIASERQSWTVLQQFNDQRRRASRLFSSRWDDDDEEEEATVKTAKSFEEAEASIQKEDDDEQIGKMGDFDANPSYTDAETERIREAVRQRTEALGIKKSTVSEQTKKELEQRAKQRAANRLAGGGAADDNTFGGIDLSQISQTAPRGPDDNVPSMFYEPEQDMTEEEMKEADPVGQLPIMDQLMDTLNTATWPKPAAAAKDVVILVTTVALSALLLVGWDGFLRDTYTNFQFIPKPEEVTQPKENLVLPDGWTDNMSEEDLLKFQDAAAAMGSAPSSAPATNGFPDL